MIGKEILSGGPSINRASLVAQLVKNLPAMQETPSSFLGWEDLLENYLLQCSWSCLMAQMINIPPAMRKTLGLIPGLDDVLEKGMATHSCIMAWRIPWTEEPGNLQSMGSQRVGMTEQFSLSLFKA